MIGYIDSSFLLSIVFQDENYEKTISLWNDLKISLSSVLLEIETRINLFKFCLNYKKDKELYKERLSLLNDLLLNINRKNIDQEILLEIKNFDKLKQLKSLDAIHLASARIFSKVADEKIVICSYDNQLIKIAKGIGFKII